MMTASDRTNSILSQMEEDGYGPEEMELMAEYLSQFENCPVHGDLRPCLDCERERNRPKERSL